MHHLWQPVWDLRLAWASGFAVWTEPVWWSGTGIAARTYPQRSGLVMSEGLVRSEALRALLQGE